jgi:Lipopolysaccharide export system permease LptF/LptG
MKMTAIDRYILRTTLTSFAIVVVTLTGVIWITQALRAIDLMTSQGQTILTFLGITLASTLAASVWIIYKSILIEPPAATIEAVSKLAMHAVRLVRRSAPA